MRTLVLATIALGLASCGLQDTLRGSSEIIARTEHLSLHRDTLTDIVAGGRKIRPNRALVEELAFRWVDMALLAERLADGDSLLDSATVVRAMWTDAEQWLVDAYHEKLAGDLVRVDSATVDSAYADGAHRLIQHILVRATPDMSLLARAAARRRAEGVRARLTAGSSWDEENALNEDLVARRAGGSVGVIEAGQRVAQFDHAAFQLAPGELSEVVETPYGYHVIRRPALDEVRVTYTAEIEDILTARMDSTVLRQISDRWNVRVKADAAALAREAASAPLRAYQAPASLGSYRGGTFTTADFLLWLQAMSGEVFRTIPGARDDQLVDLIQSLIRNEALIREAREAGMTLDADSLTSLKSRLRTEIDQVRSVTGLDSAMEGFAEPEERRAAGVAAINDYFRRVVGRTTAVVSVPPFLAQVLRETMDWELSQAAIDATLERIVRLGEEQLEPSGVPPILPPGETADDSIADPDDAS